MKRICLAACFGLCAATALAQPKPIVVGSLLDTEGNLLAEIFSQVLEATGEAPVKRRFSLGHTGIVLAALEQGEIHVLPEYSGTVANVILKRPELTSFPEIASQAQALGYVLGAPLGFNNTYALGMTRARATELKLRSVGDLQRAPQLKGGFSPEFLASPYGLPGVQKTYGFTLTQTTSLEHSVAYDALTAGAIDVTDLYTTDARIARLDLVALEDDRNFFVAYLGLALVKKEFVQNYPRSWAALQRLAGTLPQQRMVALNAQVELDHQPVAVVARMFLQQALPDLARTSPVATGASTRPALGSLTLEHLWLVLVALLMSVGLGVPLGILGSRSRALGQVVVGVSGVIQTLPTVALLVVLIPLTGIGAWPALLALFLYGLFPVVRGTIVGLAGVDLRLLEVCDVMGMPRRDRLWRVELPLASPAILNGIKLTAVTNVGTATLAALIGGGGYGSLIIQGLGINDMTLVMWGAVPSALMALAVHAVGEALDRVLLPRGLRVVRAPQS
jgi:osmoprotectant transport system permease protein